MSLKRLQNYLKGEELDPTAIEFIPDRSPGKCNECDIQICRYYCNDFIMFR